MQPLYIIFDQLPQKEDGGLVATYATFVEQFKDTFDIKLVSVFANSGNDIPAFEDVEIINLSTYVLDNRFFRGLSFLKQGKIRPFFHAVASAFRFFSFIPRARRMTDQLCSGSPVIAVSPAAAIFIGKKVRFILEIHTKFEYFWGSGIIGKMQANLAAKPALTLFRNKTDAQKGSALFSSSYLYNGVAEPNSDTQGTRVARKPYSALYVGGLVEHKNPLLLVRCAERVRRSIPSFTLDIYGVGDLEDTLRQEVEKRGLGDTVHLKGFIDDKSIYSHYEQFWFSSNLEGFGLVIVEAMANKTPVITTNWGDAVEEIVIDGETGYVVNDEEQFCERALELFGDPQLARNIAQRAYDEYRESFSVEQNSERWKKILSEVFPPSDND